MLVDTRLSSSRKTCVSIQLFLSAVSLVSFLNFWPKGVFCGLKLNQGRKIVKFKLFFKKVAKVM